MRTVILGSGTGSNCKSLLESQASNNLGSAKIVAIFSDIEDSGILEVGRHFGIKSVYLGPYNISSDTHGESDHEWISAVDQEKPDLIVLAGFMRILSSYFINFFGSRIINLHPSLLPSFKGLNAINQAWDEGVKITGCTVHWVSRHLDMGKIIDQRAVRISSEDSLDSLIRKVHIAEHFLLPTVVENIAKGTHTFPYCD